MADGYPMEIVKPVELAPGQSLNITGNLGESDTTLTTSMTTSYSANNATGSATIMLNGAATLALQLTAVPAGGQLQCYGTLNGTDWIGPLQATPQWKATQTTNGPQVTGIGTKGTIFRYDVSMFAAFQARVNAFGTGGDGLFTVTMRANKNATIVSIGQPVLIESPRDTFNFSFSDLVVAANATDVFQLYNTNGGIMRVCKIELKATATAAAYLNYKIVRSASLNAGGTQADAASSGRFDQSDGFQFAPMSAKTYSANPTTLGSTPLTIYQGKMFVAPEGSAVFVPWDVINFGGDTHSKEVMVRAATDQLSIRLDGSAIPAGLKLTGNVRVTQSD